MQRVNRHCRQRSPTCRHLSTQATKTFRGVKHHYEEKSPKRPCRNEPMCPGKICTSNYRLDRYAELEVRVIIDYTDKPSNR